MAMQGSIADHLEIRQLIERYADAASLRDYAGLEACWAEDGRWSVPDIPSLAEVKGRDNILAAFRGAEGLFPFCFLVGNPGLIEITGDRAIARVWTTEVLRDSKGGVRHAVGRYEDVLEKRDDRWVFVERVWYNLHAE